MDIKTDILVLGSGLAGLLFSLELASLRADLSISIINKKDIKSSSSYLAQGGIAAVLPGSDDHINHHIQDTLRAGCFSNNPDVVEHFVSLSAKAIAVLEKWGVAFDKDFWGTNDLALEGGHSAKRILHHKDFTGKYIMEKLYQQLVNYPNIQVCDETEALELLKTNGNSEISGTIIWNSKEKRAYAVSASKVILATGGLGSLFEYTTNPSSATGQGIAMAALVGAECADLMNIQFHPTAFWKNDGNKLPLISEAMRGAGAILRNQTSYPFMMDKGPLKDLAPRDVVCRSIVEEIENQDQPFVNLDCRSISEEQWRNHFPGIFQICKAEGLNPRKAFVPVVPAAHYSCGGIKTDVFGKCNIQNLFVLGESANTGFHGSNRLASNSLLETVCMSFTLAEEISGMKWKKQDRNCILLSEWTSDPLMEMKKEKHLQMIRSVMSKYCAVVKNTSGLLQARKELLQLEDKIQSGFPLTSVERKSLELSLFTAKKIVDSSLETKSNQGVFFNQDLEKVIAKDEQY